MSAYFLKNLLKYFKVLLSKQKVRRTVNVGLFFSNFSTFKNIFRAEQNFQEKSKRTVNVGLLSRNLFHIPKYFLKQKLDER